MTRFLQPEWFWALTLLPLVMLWRGRRGPVAAIQYSDVGLARAVARVHPHLERMVDVIAVALGAQLPLELCPAPRIGIGHASDLPRR